MRFSRLIAGAVIAGWVLLSSTHLCANVANAPASVSAALIIKLAALEKNLSSGGNITIYVLGAPDVAAALKEGIGTKIGGGALSDVLSGDEMPAAKPSILFLGNATKVDEVISYTRAQKVLSATGTPDLISKGVTLGIGVENDKPVVLLNVSSSSEEGLDWNPAIMKIVKTIK